MNSKRAALWLAMGGLLGCGSVSVATAADRFVSEASFRVTGQTQATAGVSPTAQTAYFAEAGGGNAIAQVGHCGCEAAPACGCEPQCGCETASEPECGCESACEPQCGCEPSCDGGCDSGCADAGLLANLCDCDLGEPFVLFGEAAGYSIGGWVQTGYSTKALPLFNSRAEELQLQQAWVYAEKAIDTADGFDIGGRFDYLYGTDGPDTQAFGIDNDHWDNDWDNGPDNSGYGHAIPQVYLEAGYGDLSIKAGHFFTIIGWEVVAAPDNFFYSHAYTMYNSEPFTHTGALATYSASDDLTIYGGYVLGWDSGFEDNGDAFLGGASFGVSEDITVTYATVAGRFGKAYPDGGDSERGYMHSIVTDVTLTDQLQYISQSDLLESHDAAGNVVRSTFGLNNYLIYTISDCLAAGARFEYYNANEGIYNPDNKIYALTTGVNFKPHANVLIRPEIRFDWVDGNPDGILEDNRDDQTTFGIDSIVTF